MESLDNGQVPDEVDDSVLISDLLKERDQLRQECNAKDLEIARLKKRKK